MGIDLLILSVYNLLTEINYRNILIIVKLYYYNTYLIFCQEKGILFMEVPDLVTLRELLGRAISECFDTSTLDLVYKILICDSIR